MTVCIWLQVLTITLVKYLLVAVFSVEDTPVQALFFHDNPLESFAPMVILDIISVLIPTFLLFSWAHGVEVVPLLDVAEVTYLLPPLHFPASPEDLIPHHAQQLQKRPEDLCDMFTRVL